MKLKDKYKPINISHFNAGDMNWHSVFFMYCKDCGCVVYDKEIHNKVCIVVREGQIK